jgi:hypothetical protein
MAALAGPSPDTPGKVARDIDVKMDFKKNLTE